MPIVNSTGGSGGPPLQQPLQQLPRADNPGVQTADGFGPARAPGQPNVFERRVRVMAHAEAVTQTPVLSTFRHRKDLQQGEQCSMWTEHGCLFDVSPEWSLCHCVSKDLKMGAGIAASFKEQFGGVEDLRRQRVDVGGVGVLQKEGRHVYYLVTKNRYSDKPSLEALKASLVALRERILVDGVRCLAMPKLGCGLDRLDWRHVRDLVFEVFNKVPLEIQVRLGAGLAEGSHRDLQSLRPLSDLSRLHPSNRLALPRRRSA